MPRVVNNVTRTEAIESQRRAGSSISTRLPSGLRVRPTSVWLNADTKHAAILFPFSNLGNCQKCVANPFQKPPLPQALPTSDSPIRVWDSKLLILPHDGHVGFDPGRTRLSSQKPGQPHGAADTTSSAVSRTRTRRHVTEARSISPSRASSRLSAAEISRGNLHDPEISRT